MSRISEHPVCTIMKKEECIQHFHSIIFYICSIVLKNRLNKFNYSLFVYINIWFAKFQFNSIQSKWKFWNKMLTFNLFKRIEKLIYSKNNEIFQPASGTVVFAHQHIRIKYFTIYTCMFVVVVSGDTVYVMSETNKIKCIHLFSNTFQHCIFNI